MSRVPPQHYSPTALLGTAVALFTAVLFGRVPSEGRWASDVTNFAHAPAFGVMTLILIILLRQMPSRRTSVIRDYSIAVAGAVVLGALIELLQMVTGRDASLDDLVMDTLGALAATAFLALVDPLVRALPSRRACQLTVLLVGIVSTVVIVAPLATTATAYIQRNRNFPTLVDFGSPVGTYFLYVYSAVTVNQETLPRSLGGGTDGVVGLHARLGRQGKALGLGLSEIYPDWRGHGRLALDLANPNDVPLLLQVNVRDHRHSHDWQAGYVGTIEIAPRSRRTHTTSLREMAAGEGRARVDLGMVDLIDLSPRPENHAKDFYILRIWLE